MAADPKIPSGHRHVAGDLLDVAQHRQSTTHLTVTQWITHRSPNDQETQVSNDLRQFLEGTIFDQHEPPSNQH
jgi:hypothetical protein